MVRPQSGKDLHFAPSVHFRRKGTSVLRFQSAITRLNLVAIPSKCRSLSALTFFAQKVRNVSTLRPVPSRSFGDSPITGRSSTRLIEMDEGAKTLFEAA
jgi:hypothetical protein